MSRPVQDIIAEMNSRNKQQGQATATTKATSGLVVQESRPGRKPPRRKKQGKNSSTIYDDIDAVSVGTSYNSSVFSVESIDDDDDDESYELEMEEAMLVVRPGELRSSEARLAEQVMEQVMQQTPTTQDDDDEMSFEEEFLEVISPLSVMEHGYRRSDTSGSVLHTLSQLEKSDMTPLFAIDDDETSFTESIRSESTAGFSALRSKLADPSSTSNNSVFSDLLTSLGLAKKEPVVEKKVSKLSSLSGWISKGGSSKPRVKKMSSRLARGAKPKARPAAIWDDNSDAGFSMSVCDEESINDDFSVSVASTTNSVATEYQTKTPKVNNRKGLADKTSATVEKKPAWGLFGTTSSKADNNSISTGQSSSAKSRRDDGSVSKKSILSKKSTRSIRTKPARQLVDDIETGSSFNCFGGSDPNAKEERAGRKRKCLWVTAIIIILLAATIGALVGLDIIAVPDSVENVLPTLADSGDEDKTYYPTFMPTQEGSISTIPWYVDWTAYQCVQDCEGPPPCGGKKPSWESSSGSLRRCCEVHFEGFFSEHWTLDDCMSMSGGSGGGEGGGEGTSDTLPGQGTQEGTVNYPNPNKPKTGRPTRRPASSSEQTSAKPPQTYQGSPANSGMLYYADWNLSECTEEDSSTKKPWNVGYTTASECCLANFQWSESSDCYRGDGAGSVVDSLPAPAPADDPRFSFLYHADFNVGKCIQVDAAKIERWQTGYESEDECCQSNFSWDESGDCYAGDDTGSIPAPSIVILPSPDSQGENTSGGDNTQSSHLFLPDFAVGKCVQDDDSQVQRFGSTYNSEEVCCLANFKWDVKSDCYAGDDTAYPSYIPTTSPSLRPSPKPTPKPSQHPTVKADDATSTPDQTAQPGDVDSSNQMMLYYANFEARKCTLEESSQKSPWEKSYETEHECCLTWFSWDKNSGCHTAPDDNSYEVDTGGLDTTAGADDGGTADGEDNVVMMYYATLDAGNLRCTQQDSSQMQRWDLGYATQRECCEANFADENSDCFADGDSVMKSSTEEVMASSTETSSPTTRPSPSPTLKPSPGPTARPTTANPTLHPTAKPTTANPTVKPTPWTLKPISASPSRKPSSSPLRQPTSRPTTSPNGEKERLLDDLMAASPLSSDSLDDEKSDQYRSMEWLLTNVYYSTYSDERKVQRWALATFYYSLWGDEWTVNDGWMGTASFNECTWHGLTCNSAGMVTRIEMSENGIWGNIPLEVSLFRSIEYLGLTKNLVRSFPAEVLSLVNLKVLDLDKNIIEEIPSGVDPTWSQLEELYLSNNKIGAIPDELFPLKNVKQLWLSNNGIVGTLPTALGMMTKLEELDLETNYFYGSIPSEIYSLVNLRNLYLMDNSLTGKFSPLISQMTSLTSLDLDTNQISGELPTEIGLLSQLSELYLGGNKISGQLPWGHLSQLVGLTHLDISRNFLNSTIGSRVGSLTNLESLQLDNNYRENQDGSVASHGMQGPIPGVIGNLHQLQELRLDNNFIDGTIPSSMGNLQSLVKLRMESNNLKSSIPSTLGNLANLQFLHLWSNYLESSISGQLGKLSQLQELFLDDNEITGTIPPELGQLTSAVYISLANNNLEGAIPPTFGMLSSLERLDVQFNYMYGELPPQMANLPALAMMKLEGNYFYGDIPDGVCNNVQYLSANCAVTRQPTSLPTSTPLQGASALDSFRSIPTPSPTLEYWWSCNCCSSCYPG